MAVEIKVPSVGESISEVTLTKWIKKDGEWVNRDEVIAELESEKATFEINAEKAGILHTIAKEDETLKIGDIVCTIDDTAEKPAGAGVSKEAEKAQEVKPEARSADKESNKTPTEEKKSEPIKEAKASPVAAAILADKKID